MCGDPGKFCTKMVTNKPNTHKIENITYQLDATEYSRVPPGYFCIYDFVDTYYNYYGLTTKPLLKKEQDVAMVFRANKEVQTKHYEYSEDDFYQTKRIAYDQSWYSSYGFIFNIKNDNNFSFGMVNERYRT